MEVIEDGKITVVRIEDKLKEMIRSEDEFNRKMLKQNKFILLFTFLILILTLILVYQANVPK